MGKSQMVRIFEILSGTTFTSPLAVKLINISALGFLGFLAFLGFVPLPGWHRCFGFSGFSGFFGLIGFAFMVEFVQRRKAKTAPQSDNARPDQPSSSTAVSVWRDYFPALLKVAPLVAAWWFCMVFCLPMVNELAADAGLTAVPGGFSQFQKFAMGVFRPEMVRVRVGLFLFLVIAELLLPPWRKYRRILLRGITTAINGVILLGLLGLIVYVVVIASSHRPRDMHASSSSASNSSFGPVMERVLTAGNDAHSFYSFDLGDYVPGPTDFDPADEKNKNRLWEWMTANHVDVFVRTLGGLPVLVRSEIVSMEMTEYDFDRLSPAILAENVGWNDSLNGQFRPQEINTHNWGNYTLAFQNRYKVTGVLQVLAVTSDPPGVKIRYKLVRQPNTTRSP